MKYYDKNKKSSYLNYWDVNNSYGWVMSQKLPVNNFKWTKDTFHFNKDFTKKKQESDEGCFLEVDVRYLEKLHALHNGSPFLTENRKFQKVGKLVINLHDKTEYAIHIKNSNQAFKEIMNWFWKKFIELLSFIKILG